MPWSMSNPPPPAKNWSPEEKRRCISAANSALSEGKSEQDAIFACIGAAGKSTRRKQRTRISAAQVTLYEQERDKVKLDLERLANGYLSGNLSLPGFKEEMRDRLKQYYIRVALLAKGSRPFTRRDREDLQKFLGLIYGFLDGFAEDLGNYKVLATDRGVISRATSYGVGWGVFSRFSLPGPIADMLPSLPGISCLGDGDCGCILEWEVVDDIIRVYWYVSPFKEHCPVCVDNGIEWSPYEILLEDIDTDEWDEDDFWEDDFSF